MGDDERSFAQVKTRLEEIASEAAKKDTPLEKCLDLLEEGERLARRCTELIDQTEWRAAAGEQDADVADDGAAGGPEAEAEQDRAEDPEAGEEPVGNAAEPAEDAAGDAAADDEYDEETGEPDQGS